MNVGPSVQWLFSPRCRMSQYTPKEVSSNTSEGVELPSRVRASRQRGEAAFFHILYIGCQKKVCSVLMVDLPKDLD